MMEGSFDDHRPIRVNFERMAILIKRRNLTQKKVSEEAAKLGGRVATKTISRALKGEPIEIGKLRLICKVLSVSLGELLASKKERLDELTQPAAFEGRWNAQFVEMRVSKGIRVVNEKISVWLNDGVLEAEFSPATEGETENETVKWIRAVGNNIIGESWVDDWDAPVGIGLFHLTMHRGDQMLDGVTSWADPDTGLVEWSRYVWVREDCDDSAVDELASTLITEELEHYKSRMISRFGLKSEL